MREQLIDSIELDFELSRRLCKESLNHFMRTMWPVIEPTTKYIHGWHIDAICEHLEAVKKFEIKRLIINMPPRHIKSIAVSTMFPAWVWASEASRRFVTASYSYSLSVRDAAKMRDIIMSPEYEQMVGQKWTLKDDMNLKHRFENTETGFRFSTSVGGTMTGEGGDFILVDDPLNAIEAPSEIAREACWSWWRSVMSTRVNDPNMCARVIVQQRLHEGDLTGRILDEAKRRTAQLGEDVDDYEMLILPAEYKKSSVLVSKTSLNWKDPRKEDGDILWPERYNKKSIDELRADLGSAAADAQLAQDPKPSSGGLFNKDWWRVLDMSPSDISQIVQFWDCAQKPGITNDYSVCATWAITSNGYYIMDVWRDKVTTPVLEVMAKELYEKYKPSAVVIEDKSAGSPLIQYLLAFTTMPVLAYNPGKLDKETRATAATPTVEAGKVAIPKMAKWRDTFVSEHERFPKSTHDDQVDTTSMAIAWLKMRSGDGPRIRTL